MEKSDKIGELAAALAKAQGQFNAIERNREVKVSKGGKFLYTFSYATLDAIVEAVRKPLADNGLSYVQGLSGSDNGSVVETMLMHSSGEWVSTVIPIHQGANDNKAQALGSGITYAKRYALTAILGIVAEDDTDGRDDEDIQVRDTSRPTPKRSADDPNWTGPLGKSDLKVKLRDLSGEIDNCQDDGELLGILEKQADLVNQCARDLPDWWMYKNGDDVKGLKQSIHVAGQQLGVRVQKYLDAAESSRGPGRVIKQQPQAAE